MDGIKATSYSIGNSVEIEILDKTGRLNQIFDSFYPHYENFKAKSVGEKPDLSIEIGDFQPDLSNCYESGNGGFYCTKDWFYVPQEKFKGAKWRFEVSGFESEQTRIKVDCNSLGRIFITGNVIDSFIHLKLLEKKTPIIHASAVSKDGVGCAFSSIGGGGKTTTAMRMVARGFYFLGDNFIMLDKGDALSFPTSLSIFTYNLTPEVLEALTRSEKRRLNIKKMIYWATRGRAKFFTKINPKRVVGDILPRTSLKYCFFLIPNSNRESPVEITESTQSDFIQRIVRNHRLEFSLLDEYLVKYSYFYPESRVASHWAGYKAAICQNLPSDAKYFTVHLPRKPAQDISGIIEKIIGKER